MPSSADQPEGEVAAEPAHLSISAHVVVQLGEELVTDVEQALLELAKNAYDADSESCEIRVEPKWLLNPTDPAFRFFGHAADAPDAGALESLAVGRVRVRDYGSGLSADAVSRGWLRISSSVKRARQGKQKDKTPKGRTPVGDKGLGRLATMKIGRVLRMKTALATDSHWRTVTFSWGDFTQDRTLEDVPVLTGIDESEPVDRAGTIIEIIGLAEDHRWRELNYIESQLVPNLSSLVHPFRTGDNFDISVHLDNRAYGLHSLEEDVLNLASAKFEVSWDGVRLQQSASFAPTLFRGERGDEGEKRFEALFSGSAKHALIAWLAEDRKLKDRGITFHERGPWLFSLKEDLDGQPFPSNRQYPDAEDPGPFEASLYNFLFHQSVKEKLSQAGLHPATLQAMSQVAIYRDGFRVRANRDWLRLSESATSGSSFYGLRPSNVIGHFSVSNERNPRLIEKSDREGFVDNAAFRGFMVLGLRARDYANTTLELVRLKVREFSKRLEEGSDSPPNRSQLRGAVEQSKSSAEANLAKIVAELTEAQNALASERGVVAERMAFRIEQAHKALSEIGQSVERQSKASLQLAEMGDDDREYAMRLLDAAAVGLSARSLAHELHQHIRQLRDGTARISQANKRIKDPDVAAAVRNLNGVVRELGKTVATIDPMLPGSRSIKEKFSLDQFLGQFIEARSSAAQRADVRVKMEGTQSENPLMIRFSRARLLQVVENLFQNSLYWLRKGPLVSGAGRNISVLITDKGFLWFDNGPGVKPSIESAIFDPYVSDKPAAEGSGLGLHIASTFLELEGCSISLSDKRNEIGRRYVFEVDLLGARYQEHQRELDVTT